MQYNVFSNSLPVTVTESKSHNGPDILQRDSWWRGTVRKTPNPGAYEIPSMVDELKAMKIEKTYGFKSSGRKKNADPSRRGDYLMPGLYSTKDCFSDSKSKSPNACFRSVGRENKTAIVVGIQDKQLLESDISPAKYAKKFELIKKIPSKHAVFRSESSRFPTLYFTPKKGPSPAEYLAKEGKSITVTSSFVSSTPRFKKPRTFKTPGPGAYTKMLQYPMPVHIHEVGQKAGLFFPSGVYW